MLLGNQIADLSATTCLIGQTRKRPAKENSNNHSTPTRSRREWFALVKECNKIGLTPSAFAHKKELNKCTVERVAKRFCLCLVLIEQKARIKFSFSAEVEQFWSTWLLIKASSQDNDSKGERIRRSHGIVIV